MCNINGIPTPLLLWIPNWFLAERSCRSKPYFACLHAGWRFPTSLHFFISHTGKLHMQTSQIRKIFRIWALPTYGRFWQYEAMNVSHIRKILRNWKSSKKNTVYNVSGRGSLWNDAYDFGRFLQPHYSLLHYLKK